MSINNFINLRVNKMVTLNEWILDCYSSITFSLSKKLINTPIPFLL